MSRPGRGAGRAAVLPLAAVVAGLVLGGVTARWVGMPFGKLASTFAIAAAGLAAVLVPGTLLGRALRRRRAAVAGQVALTGAVTATAALAGLGTATLAMMPSAHELGDVLALLPLCAGVGLAYGLVSASRTARDLEALAAAARRLDSGDLRLQALRVQAAPGGSAEVREVAEALAAAAERLGKAFASERAMEASRRDLVAWASHDLRTPLASLRAVAEALADEVVSDPATRRRYLDSLVTQVDRLANLVDDLFELSQIEAGALALHFEPTDLASLITEILKVFEPDAEARGVGLASDLPGAVPGGSPPALIPAGRDQLGRVLANLLVNALRHTPPGGQVVVALRDRPNAATVTVRDGCGGIPEAELPHVFERLWRADPARSGGGAGLGLAIARGLVEAHGGTIAARNAPEAGGCEFSVELPRSGPAAPIPPVPPVPGAARGDPGRSSSRRGAARDGR